MFRSLGVIFGYTVGVKHLGGSNCETDLRGTYFSTLVYVLLWKACGKSRNFFSVPVKNCLPSVDTLWFEKVAELR